MVGNDNIGKLRNSIANHKCYPIEKIGINLLSCDYNSPYAAEVSNGCTHILNGYNSTFKVKGIRKERTNL